MSDEMTAIERISQIQDLIDLNSFMNDKHFEDALGIALKCIAKPDLPPAIARKTLVKMEAYAFEFKMRGLAYMTIKKGRAGSEENMKKNVYYSVSDQCHELAQTLKYISRESI